MKQYKRASVIHRIQSMFIHGCLSQDITAAKDMRKVLKRISKGLRKKIVAAGQKTQQAATRSAEEKPP